MDRKLDDTHGVEIEKGIFWIGFADYESGFSNNPYLLIDGDDAVLFDPGPGHPVFRDIIIRKIEELINPVFIKYIVVHHQDPDLCGLIPLLENFLDPNVVIMCHPRTALFLPYYGIRKRILPVGDSDILKLKSGRRIRFIYTPYLHFSGATVSYDEKTGTLFSSDIFGFFDKEWTLYADDRHIDLCRKFMQHYFGSWDALKYVYNKFKKLSPKRILPQHGAVILKNPEKFIEVLNEVEPGIWIKELEKTPDDREKMILLNTGKEWLKYWLKKEIKADSLDELSSLVFREGPATVSLLYDVITRKASELGVENPLTSNKVHEFDNMDAASSSGLVDTFRARLLKSQFNILYGNEQNIDILLQKRLQAIEVELVIVFIDIRGFTSWSEGRSPDEIIGMLNKEQGLISNIINENSGRVNKVMGDGLLCYFPSSKLPESLLAFFKINNRISDTNMLSVGIGCSLGRVVMGDIGEEVRLDYSVIGSTVNTASRMCDASKKNHITFCRNYFNALPEATQSMLMLKESFREIAVKAKPTDPEKTGFTFDALE